MDWMKHAACKGEDATLFFPERTTPVGAAKLICHGCPVKTDCLEYAMAEQIKHGIWGGLSERQRRELRSERYHAGVLHPPKACAVCAAEFSPGQRAQKYCSVACRERNRIDGQRQRRAS
jgi:WhiB family redox-sensing transcriptional regulator